jgi:hypothetical protein
MQETLEQCERDVEQARAKFAHDLAILRSPETFTAFTDDLKQDVVDTKDEWVERAKESVQARSSAVLEQFKARAAANPTAALMIGAGVTWYLLRNPPITPGLIGLGLYQLWRTDAHPQPHADTKTYLHQGRERLKEQAYAAARDTAEMAASALSSSRDKVVSKSGEVFDKAKGTVVNLAGDMREQVAEVATEVREFVTERAEHLPSVRAPVSIQNQEVNDRALLNVAGVAVAAAFFLALRRRSAA